MENKKKEYFKGLNRREYIQKTYEMIQRDGIENVSIRKVANELGCSSAALYRYFENFTELLYFAELRTLDSYIKRLNEGKKVWKGPWDIYVGVWDCYSREAFANPEAYNLLFLTVNSEMLQPALEEYYRLFPEDIAGSNQFFTEMLGTSSFRGRDYEMCKKCVEAGVLREEDALLLNRIICQLYRGYLKEILDERITDPDEIDQMVHDFVEDVDRICMDMASDLHGYEGYHSLFD